MTVFIRNIKTALLATLGLTFLVSIVYPLLVWGLAQLVFPQKANASLITKNGSIVGSALIGQDFRSPQYFHPRPSAAGKGYDAASSSGSNLGPINAKFLTEIKARVAAYRQVNGLAENVKVPQDAVTASASGLDPHISPANAALQIPRIAKTRGLPEARLRDLVETFSEGPDLGILGERAVNVLKLNLALDETQP